MYVPNFFLYIYKHNTSCKKENLKSKESKFVIFLS